MKRQYTTELLYNKFEFIIVYIKTVYKIVRQNFCRHDIQIHSNYFCYMHKILPHDNKMKIFFNQNVNLQHFHNSCYSM